MVCLKDGIQNVWLPKQILDVYLTKEMITQGLSRPWYRSAVRISISRDNDSVRRFTWPLYIVNTPISPAGTPGHDTLKQDIYISLNSLSYKQLS